MAIKTSIARHYAIRTLLIGVACVGFFAWGAYDYGIKIPRSTERADRFEAVASRIQELEERGQEGPPLSAAERVEFDSLTAEVATLAAKGTPERPGTFDHLVCWGFMICLPLAPYYFWRFYRTRRRRHRLEDDGSLVMPEGSWSREEIADIDMSRWMAKSVAHVVHRDGSRVKLDAYLYQDMDLIVGALAHERYPEQWTEKASPPKPVADESDLPEPEDPDEPEIEPDGEAHEADDAEAVGHGPDRATP